jgi:hypothetical protein
MTIDNRILRGLHDGKRFAYAAGREQCGAAFLLPACPWPAQLGKQSHQALDLSCR